MGLFGRARAYIGVFALKYMIRRVSPSTTAKVLGSKVKIITEKQRQQFDEVNAQIKAFQKSYDYSMKLLERAEREINRAQTDAQAVTIIEKYTQLSVEKHFRLENELDHLRKLLRNVGRRN